MSNTEKVTPVITWLDDKTSTPQSVTNHPSFGMVTVGRVHTNGIKLHASDLSHQEVIELRFYEGETQDVGGVVRHRQKRDTPLLSVQFSPAQWASMISSFGMSDGVPCTLLSKREGKLTHLPEIAQYETTRQRFDRQIKEAATAEMEKLMESVKMLAALSAKGKANKGELAAALNKLQGVVANMPSNLAYTTELIQESVNNIVSSGRAEIEAVSMGVATRLGIGEISRLATLEDKSKGANDAD